MIRGRQLALDALNDSALAPFIARNGSLPPQQMPEFAHAIISGKLLAFEFLKDGARIGYSLVQIRQRILVEIFHGPVVTEAAHYLPCIEALKPLLRKIGLLILRILPPLDMPRPAGLPSRFNWATSFVDISKDEPALFQSFSPNHRQSIRKGLAAPLIIKDLREGEEPAYANAYAAMFARRGIKISPSETVAMLERLRKTEKAFIFGVRQFADSPLVGGGVFLRTGITCNYYQGWSERTAHAVLHTLVWKAMLRAKSLGCSLFNLGGYSLDESDTQLLAINDFKRWFRGGILSYPSTSVIPLYPLLTPLLRALAKRL